LTNASSSTLKFVLFVNGEPLVTICSGNIERIGSPEATFKHKGISGQPTNRLSTRSSDLAPGVLTFLVQSEQVTAPQFDTLVNHESGFLSISGTSFDMRVLLAKESTDARTAKAAALFCYSARNRLALMPHHLVGSTP